jgi:hypothetical protein
MLFVYVYVCVSALFAYVIVYICSSTCPYVNACVFLCVNERLNVLFEYFLLMFFFCTDPFAYNIICCVYMFVCSSACVRVYVSVLGVVSM